MIKKNRMHKETWVKKDAFDKKNENKTDTQSDKKDTHEAKLKQREAKTEKRMLWYTSKGGAVFSNYL